MKVVFLLGTKRGFSTLRAALEVGMDVCGVISLAQDGHEKERYESHIRSLAREFGVPVFETVNLKDRDYVSLLARDLKPDIGFIIGARIMVPQKIYEVPRLGMFGAHDSLLPKYRGFAPLNWALINGEKETGVSLFQIGDQMDAGDIFAQEKTEVGPNETAIEVYERICQITARLVVNFYKNFTKGQLSGSAQNHQLATYTCSRTPEDGLINWQDSSHRVHNFVRALTDPYPGAFTYYKGEKITILKSEISAQQRNYVGRIPGRVIALETTGAVQVLTGDGALRLLKVRTEALANVLPTEIIRSVRASLG